MAERIDINSMLARLDRPDAGERELAAAELTDLIEANYLTRAELKRVVSRLLRAARRETDPSAKETAFNGLSEASIVGGSNAVDADAVVELMDELTPDCLEHALVVLGFSTDPKFKAKVKAYLTHEDKDIRETAQASLAQIEHQEKKATTHKPRIKKRA